MRDINIMTIIQNAILYVAGNEGIARFNKAGYGSVAKDIVHADGSLDLPRLMNIMLDVFPEEQASAIADNVLAKYVEMSDNEKKMPQHNAKEAQDQAEAGGMSYEDNLAKYLETEASDVKDLINEARMIRMAMGKTAPPKATNGGAVAHAIKPFGQDNEMLPSEPVISIVSPGAPEPIRDLKPPVPEPVRASLSTPEPAAKAPARIDIDAFTAKTRPDLPDMSERAAPRIDINSLTANTRPAIPVPSTGDLGAETLESEIKAFVEARKAYSSVDIMDFIRYLKDKGYHFQENSVLESVYTWVEERKSRERAALLVDIQSFLGRMPWPSESEVSTYIDQKKSDGIMCESSEIKRMILVEMIRKH